MDPQPTALDQLADFYLRDGYVRGPIPERLMREGWRYHKGWELRISVTPDDLPAVQSLIAAAGFNVAQPYVKKRRMIQPIYGLTSVRQVLRAAGQDIQ